MTAKDLLTPVHVSTVAVEPSFNNKGDHYEQGILYYGCLEEGLYLNSQRLTIEEYFEEEP